MRWLVIYYREPHSGGYSIKKYSSFPSNFGWFFRSELALKRVKICELINCIINVMYITRNNVGSEFECSLWSLKTHFFGETSKISMIFDKSATVGRPIANHRPPYLRPNGSFGHTSTMSTPVDLPSRVLRVRSSSRNMFQSWYDPSNSSKNGGCGSPVAAGPPQNNV